MMTAEMPVLTRKATTVWSRENRRKRRVEQLARAVLAEHYCFRGRADRFELVERNDVLTVRGCVPSFYLKQVLQTVLMNLDGVSRVVNQVNVVSSDGLSSVRGE